MTPTFRNYNLPLWNVEVGDRAQLILWPIEKQLNYTLHKKSHLWGTYIAQSGQVTSLCP